MKNLFLIFIAVSFILSPMELSVNSNSQIIAGIEKANAQSSKRRVKKSRRPRKSKLKRSRRPRRKSTRRARRSYADLFKKELREALRLSKAGDYARASVQLYKISKSPRFRKQRMHVKYLLGLMLYDMKLYQLSAFQFVDVVKDGTSQYINKALEKLSLAADTLGNEALLNYAISKVKLSKFPKEQRDKLRFRIGEYQFKSDEFKKAAYTFSEVAIDSPLYAKAKYMEGLTWATIKQPSKAINAFLDLVETRGDKNITDPSRVAGLMGLARSYYQNKEWENAIATYRKIPRDTEAWHDTLFEMSWAQLRAAKFRDVLSNFHSLHSTYYEDYYYPESLLLRSLVYLYICQYDEMEKVLGLFDEIYYPVRKKVRDYSRSVRDPLRAYKNMEEIVKNFDEIKQSKSKRESLRIPFIVARRISKEGDFSKEHAYIQNLHKEDAIVDHLPDYWRMSSLGKYARVVMKNRISRAQKNAGKMVINHIRDIRRELLELSKQKDFAKFEMLTGKKEQLKKKIVKEDKKNTVDQDSERDFYIQNGYEYWPFQGEYWLDEIGNYYYLGKQRCE